MINVGSGAARSADTPSAAARGWPSLMGLALGPLRELGIAVGLVALVSVTRWALGFVFPGLGVFSLYFPVVLIAALIGGWRAGALAMVLSGAVPGAGRWTTGATGSEAGWRAGIVIRSLYPGSRR